GTTDAKLSNPGALAVDPNHKMLYVNDGGNAEIKRFTYSAISDLNADLAPNAILKSPSTFSAFQLYINPTNVDLWAAYYHNTMAGGGAVFPAAYSLATNSLPAKTFRLTEANSANDFQGVAYSSANGGTLYLCNPLNNPGLYWLTGVDSLAAGTYSSTGFLSGT